MRALLVVGFLWPLAGHAGEELAKYPYTPIPVGECRGITGEALPADAPCPGSAVTSTGHVVADPEKWEALNKRLDAYERELSEILCLIEITRPGLVPKDKIAKDCAK